MTYLVDCERNAAQMPLARRFAEALRAASRDPERGAMLGQLRGVVMVVVDDRWTQFTIRFTWGGARVHAGAIGVPDITLRGPEGEIEGLFILPFRTKWPLLVPVRLAEILAVRRVLSAWAKRSLKVYGAFWHPSLFLGLLRVIAGEVSEPDSAKSSDAGGVELR